MTPSSCVSILILGIPLNSLGLWGYLAMWIRLQFQLVRMKYWFFCQPQSKVTRTKLFLKDLISLAAGITFSSRLNYSFSLAFEVDYQNVAVGGKLEKLQYRFR